MNKIKIMIATIAMAVSMSAIIPAYAVKCPDGTIREGEAVNALAECTVQKDAAGKGLMSTVQKAINVILSVMGIISTIMIIIGGIQYTTSAGDAQKATKAKNTILYAVIGLVIALLAYAIVNFVLGSVFSS